MTDWVSLSPRARWLFYLQAFSRLLMWWLPVTAGMVAVAITTEMTPLQGAIGGALWIWLMHTRSGTAVRAVSKSTEASGLVGINVPRISAFAFALGGALTAVGGSLISTVITLDASMGVIFTMKALIIVIMGGVGDIRGAIVAALILGIVETTVARLIDPGLTLAAAYAIFVLVLLFRPQGLFGRKPT